MSTITIARTEREIALMQEYPSRNSVGRIGNRRMMQSFCQFPRVPLQA
jgi:hypothetical protein